MSNNSQIKEVIEKQFDDLSNKARRLYPGIDEDISSYSNMTASTERLQDYLNLTMQTPLEISTNHITYM
ncbi:MAG: hypothetical protein LBT50_09780 [Prevotellaceae bacterium]|jgi:hypothetical protein|nr:hypothetical protein [Prevotellaceae bacterium]